MSINANANAKTAKRLSVHTFPVYPAEGAFVSPAKRVLITSLKEQNVEFPDEETETAARYLTSETG